MSDIPTAAEGVVEVEGIAGDNTNMPAQGAVRAWLFQFDQPSPEVTLDAVPALVTADETLVWMDLSSYTEADLRAVADALGLLASSPPLGLSQSLLRQRHRRRPRPRPPPRRGPRA